MNLKFAAHSISVSIKPAAAQSANSLRPGQLPSPRAYPSTYLTRRAVSGGGPKFPIADPQIAALDSVQVWQFSPSAQAAQGV